MAMWLVALTATATAAVLLATNVFTIPWGKARREVTAVSEFVI
jgi:hypothetical protein